MNRATLAGRTMPAPYPGRFGEFGQRIDLAAERAGAAFASRRGGVRRKEDGGRGHLNVSLARLTNRTAIATGPGWQVLKGTPASKPPPARERGGHQVRRKAIICVFRERLRGRPEDPSRYPQKAWTRSAP